MKFLHSADWHLGRLLHEQSLIEDQKLFLAWFVRTVADQRPDAVLLAGDIFDRSIPSEESVELWTGFLENFHKTNPTIPLVVIAGNHDNPIRLGFASGILKHSGIHVVGPWKEPKPLEIQTPTGEKAQIWALPFLWPGALELPGPQGPILTATQEESLREALNRILPFQDKDSLQVLVSHCFARGGRISESERTLVGTATQIDASFFQSFDYVALGHLHRLQMVTPRVWYSGSPLAYSFSEAPDVKSLLEVDLIGSAPPEVRGIPIPVSRPVKVLQGSLKDLLADPRYEPYSRAYLRVETTDTQGIAHPFNRLRQVFPYLLSFEILQEMKEQEDRNTGEVDLRNLDRPRNLEEDFSDFLSDISVPEILVPDLKVTFRALAARTPGENS